MNKKTFWFHQSAEMIYLALQSVVLFYLLSFFFNRFGLLFLPEGAFFWVILLSAIFYLPLTFISAPMRVVWSILCMVISYVSGAIIFGIMAPLVIITLLLAFLTMRRGAAYEIVSKYQFISFFVNSIIAISLLMVISYLAKMTEVEIQGYVHLVILATVFTLVGIGVTQLYHYEEYQNKKDFWKQWGIMNGLKWVSIAIFSLVSTFLLFILQFIFPILSRFLNWLITLIIQIIFSIVPELTFEGREIKLKNAKEGLEKTVNPDYTTLDTILTILFVIVVIGFIALFLYILARKAKEWRKNRGTAISKNPLKTEEIEDESMEKGSWWRKRKDTFRPYSGNEEHPIRKEYREILKIMHKKGLWSNNTMTVQQINNIFTELEFTSSLYEKLRYGDMELNEEEVKIFRREVQVASQQLKELKNEK